MSPDSGVKTAGSAPAPPEYLAAWPDGEWSSYVLDHGNPDEDLRVVDDPEALLYERLWLRPPRLSSMHPEERPEGCEDALARAKDGRFSPIYVWEECGWMATGAVAYYGVRYKPRAEAKTVSEMTT